MQHLISYFLSYTICEIVLGFTAQGDVMGSFRWPFFFMGATMVIVGTIGFYKTEKARYFGLCLFACVPLFPIGLVPLYFFWQWVEYLAQCDDRIRAKVIRDLTARGLINPQPPTAP